ncbi:hypothetical protein [Nonomuraea sp. B19D2]|uniref:hypothetical protein n=1 Tax=Nonomuraea sp. B19D2 TaxID=3159561 RepID=UPI0032DB462B
MATWRCQSNDGADDDAPPPRPQASLTAGLLITLTAAKHDEVNALLGRIRARDGNASTAQIVLAALRAYAD